MQTEIMDVHGSDGVGLSLVLKWHLDRYYHAISLIGHSGRIMPLMESLNVRRRGRSKKLVGAPDRKPGVLAPATVAGPASRLKTAFFRTLSPTRPHLPCKSAAIGSGWLQQTDRGYLQRIRDGRAGLMPRCLLGGTRCMPCQRAWPQASTIRLCCSGG